MRIGSNHHIQNQHVADDVARLEAMEREISVERRKLHLRIDRLYLSSPLQTGQLGLLAALEKQERAISSKRNRLHREIDVLRARIGLPPWRARKLDNVA